MRRVLCSLNLRRVGVRIAVIKLLLTLCGQYAPRYLRERKTYVGGGKCSH